MLFRVDLKKLMAMFDNIFNIIATKKQGKTLENGKYIDYFHLSP